jgi:hypothetical protein
MVNHKYLLPIPVEAYFYSGGTNPISFEMNRNFRISKFSEQLIFTSRPTITSIHSDYLICAIWGFSANEAYTPHPNLCRFSSHFNAITLPERPAR